MDPLEDGTLVIYTAPSKSKEDTSRSVLHYIDHFEDTKPNKWFWILDCKDMKSMNLLTKYNIDLSIVNLIQTTYADTLLKIYIINPTWAIRLLINFIMPFFSSTLHRRLVCIEEIDTISILKAAGISDKTITKILE